jgi:hypothetical protein
VVEQLEVAVVEGLGERLAWALTGRVIHRWHLRSGVKSHRANPDSFWIPEDDEKGEIAPGAHVKLVFTMRDGWTERMWVSVDKVGRWRLVGSLNNQPIGIPRLDHGQRIKFSRDHIIDITYEGDEQTSIIDSATEHACVVTCHAECHGPQHPVDEPQA